MDGLIGWLGSTVVVNRFGPSRMWIPALEVGADIDPPLPKRRVRDDLSEDPLPFDVPVLGERIDPLLCQALSGVTSPRCIPVLERISNVTNLRVRQFGRQPVVAIEGAESSNKLAGRGHNLKPARLFSSRGLPLVQRRSGHGRGLAARPVLCRRCRSTTVQVPLKIAVAPVLVVHV